MTGYKRTVSALSLSFAVYLMPIGGPRAGWLGEMLWREYSGAAWGHTAHDPWWVATDVAVALAAQFGLFLLAHWLLGRLSLLRGLGFAAALLPGIALLDYAYKEAMPARFLVEADTSPERTPWPVTCTARDVRISLDAAFAPPVPPMSIWVREIKEPWRYGILETLSCTVKVADVVRSDEGFVLYAAGDRALYRRTPRPTTGSPWSVFDLQSGRRTPIDIDGHLPVLSTDGRYTAWARPVAAGASPTQFEAVIRAVDRGGDRVVSLAAIGHGELQVLGLDAAAGTIVVSRPHGEPFVLGMDGSVREEFPSPVKAEPRPRIFRVGPGGWVAQDLRPRASGEYLVAWSLRHGRGLHWVRKGWGVSSIAPSPDGRYLAIAMVNTVSISDTRDAVYVLRAADGAEVFRRRLPKGTWPSVAFAGTDRFLDSDGGGVSVSAIQ